MPSQNTLRDVRQRNIAYTKKCPVALLRGWALFVQNGGHMPEPHFKSSLTMDEIEDNFKDTDFFAEIMEGLGKALALVRETNTGDRRPRKV